MVELIGPKPLRVILSACILMAFLALPSLAQEDARYQTVILKGKLSDPTSELPMVAAIIRFTNRENTDEWVEAVTNQSGEFVFEGVPFGKYTVAITTKEQRSILGVNAINVGKDTSRVLLKITGKADSTLTVSIEPQQMVAAIVVRKPNWPKFWKEFGIFFGIAIGVGAAAL